MDPEIERKILKELAEIKTMILTNKKVLGADEAAVYLGMSKSMLYKLTAAGNLPHSKPTGRLLFFDRDDLARWALSAKAINPEVEAEKYMKAKTERSIGK